MPGRTVAHRLMIVGRAQRIRSALGHLTRLHAFALRTAQLRRAVRMLHAPIGRPAAGLRIRLAHRSLRAHAPIRSGHVLAHRTAMARRRLRTLVDVRTPERRPNETVRTLALAAGAQLRLQAVRVAGAARLTGARLVADLARQTVVVRVAHLRAHVIRTPFAHGARRILRARHIALVRDAHVPGRALGGRRARGGHAHAALIGRRIALEAGRTGALGHLVGELAHGIRAAHAGRLARILALGVVAHLGAGALAIAAAAGDAHAAGARLLHGALAVLRAARLAPVLDASLRTGALSVQRARLLHAGRRITNASVRRIPAEARLARLHAGATRGGVHVKRSRTLAGAVRPVADLVRLAVLVRAARRHGRHTARMVRIAQRAGRTRALEAARHIAALGAKGARLSLVALVHIGARSVRLRSASLRAGTVAGAAGHAHALRTGRTASLRLRAAGQNAVAADQLVRRLALALRTVALVARRIRIAVEAGRTLALVAARQVLAHRIAAALAAARAGALVHIGAAAARRLSFVALPAGAHVRAGRRIAHALLAARTRHVLRAHVQLHVVRLRAAVARVSVAALAARRSVHHQAARIRAARQQLARMPTVVAHIGRRAQAAVRRIADRVPRTLVVRGARHNRHTAHARIRIRNGALRARALKVARLVGAQRILAAAAGRTVHGGALVNVHAAGRDVAGIVRPALLADAVRAGLVGHAVRVRTAVDVAARHLARPLRRRADKAGRTRAPERAGRILAQRVRSARQAGGAALVDVRALAVRLRLEAVATEALLVDALGVRPTVGRPLARVRSVQHDVVALEARIAGLAVGARALGLAGGRQATEGGTSTR